MTTERVFVICAAIVALAAITAIYNGAIAGDVLRRQKAELDHKRYELCITNGGSWLPFNDGACLSKNGVAP